MKKLLFSAWLLMLSMAAAAQTFVVVDKNGKRVAYDVSRLDCITFQQSPPAFTVYEVVDDGNDEPGQEEPTMKETLYTFDNVKGFAGEPHFLFAHPDTVYVDAEGEDFTFQLHTDVGYDYKLSDGWLKYLTVGDDDESLRFAAAINPSTAGRTAYIAFASKDEQQRDTLWVVQAGKYDSRYIDIDWTQTTLDNFNEQSGTAQLTFAGDVPVMGDYDVVLLPKDDSYVIRVIDQVQQTPGSKTVTLATRAGLMGNLFKGQKFTLATEAGAQGVKRFGTSSQYEDAPVYLPTKVEIFNGDEYVEVFNADKPAGHSRKAPQGFEHDFINWEYNDDGRVLWSKGNQSLSWDKFNVNLGLKGLFSFDFGDIAWEKVRMGDLKHLRIALEGGFDMELVMKYLVSAEVEMKKEWEIAKDVFKAKYKFMVGATPVYIEVGTDLMAEISLGASGEASITTGVKASSSVTYGIEWDAETGISKIAECEKNMEMVGPDVDIKAHAGARATAYPKIEIGIYKVLCPTISPQPYLKAEADGRVVNNDVAWNASVSTGLDLGLGLCLDLFFWEIDLGEIDPVNVFDIPLVKLPNEIHLFNEQEQPVLINGTKEVRYHVTHMNYLTGKYTPAKNVLVHFEPEGGEVEDEYVYTDAEGDVSAFFKLTDIDGGKLKAEVVLGAEPENEEDAMKAEDWNAVAIDYRLTATPAEQTIEKDAESAAISYKLEQYSSKVKYWWGLRDKTIYFDATGGTCNTSAVTNESGIAVATFTPNENFTEGSVTGTITIPAPSPWSGEQTAKIYVKEEDEPGVITDEGLKKAAKQKPNVYVVENKKTGETETRTYVEKWSEWNKDQDAIQFSLEDADAEGGTLGMIWGFIPLTMTDVVLALTGEQFANSPGAKFGFDIYDGQQVSADFMSMTDMTEGNIKPESRIMLRKVKSGSNSAPHRAPGDAEYAGEYELLFYLVFKNQTWNPETGNMEEGDDYEVYGRGTMKMHLPTITSFVLGYDKDWVKVGESTKVTIEHYYEEGATWDWNDVQLIGQSTDYTNARNGEDEGFFAWDAATQTLTALKSNDNNRVYVRLGLISNPEVAYTLMIATGNGWKYTMIGTSEEEITCKANSYPSFDMVWAPKDSESERFDFNSVELDPESAPAGYFSFPTSYANQGWPLHVNYNAAPGEYNLKFRLKSDHNVYCTLKVIVTEGD